MTGHEAPEWDEVQRVLLRGYPKLTWAHFLLLRIGRPEDARRFVGELLEESLLKFGWGERHDSAPVCNIVFTSSGLAALGLDRETLEGFSPEFVDGMTAGSRPRKLGDSGDSAPEKWAWGSSASPVHAALLIYAPSPETLAPVVERERRRFVACGLEELKGPSGEPLGMTRPIAERREHFGFTDGISQPRFADEPQNLRSRRTREADCLAAGELLLGYTNQAGIFPRSPVLSPTAKERAPFSVRDADFGKNGSYLVFRTLEQDVSLFWRTTLRAAGNASVDTRIELASKMIGRRPDGKPLVAASTGAVPYDPEDFDFAHDDPHGLACPFGAHIRRANPRATLARDPNIGLAKSKKHRILRRGRSFGEPFVRHLTPEALIKAADAGDGHPGPRGLYFMCFNADLANQFEFVQQTWENGPIFQGLHGEVDPIVGNPEPTSGLFTIPGDPLRSRVHDLPRFVSVRGGAYFFLPSRSALRYLASLGT
jgi:Dyp-type peroxidase family